jgi:hypothetical protein
VPTDELEEQIAAYFGWLEEQLGVELRAERAVASERRRWRFTAIAAGVAAVVALVGVLLVRSAPDRRVTTDSTPMATSASTAGPTTTDEPSPSSTPPVAEASTWAPVHLPPGYRVIGVYRGLAAQMGGSEAADVDPLERPVRPFIGFTVMTTHGPPVYVSDEGDLSPSNQPPTATIQTIEGVGELFGHTLTTIDGTVLRIGWPWIDEQPRDEQIAQVARALAPVSDVQLDALDHDAQTYLGQLPQIDAVVLGGYEIVHRLGGGHEPGAICVRIGTDQGCRPKVGNPNTPADQRQAAASVLVGDAWVIAGTNLGALQIDLDTVDFAWCSAREDGTVVASLALSATIANGVDYFLVEVPDDVDFVRLCVPDGTTLEAASTGVLVRPDTGVDNG